MYAFLPLLLLAASLAGAPDARVSPSSSTVPANLLRIEVRFDHPPVHPLDMRHVTLLDARGVPIPQALLDLPLRSRDGREVTLLLQPGRVKTGIAMHRHLGAVLHRGQHVTLRIDDPQLARPVLHSWRVTAAIRHPIAPSSWHLQVPPAGSREPLRIDFPASIDAMSVQLLAIADSDGHRLAGHAVLADGETRWIFQPDAPWRAGRYELRAHPDLEDPAGNRVCAAFEQVDLSRVGCLTDARIAFEVRGNGA